MKVKYIKTDTSLWLEQWKIYNVFSIEISSSCEIKIYSKWNSSYIYPFDIKDFEIIDSKLSKYWSWWINQFGDFVIWPKEIFERENFWRNYYEDNPAYKEIINNYYKLAKDDLFNMDL